MNGKYVSEDINKKFSLIGVPDIANYINGAVGPNGEVMPSQDEGELEKGIAPERDAPLVEPASQDKEEMGAYENAQEFQPVMPVQSQAFMGNTQNVLGPMVPMAQGAYPVPETEDGYGGNSVVRSHVPGGNKDAKHNKKESNGNKKQCINGMPAFTPVFNRLNQCFEHLSLPSRFPNKEI